MHMCPSTLHLLSSKVAAVLLAGTSMIHHDAHCLVLKGALPGGADYVSGDGATVPK